MTTQQDLARLEREQRRLLRRMHWLYQRQRDGDTSRALVVEGDGLVSQAEALLPQLDAARQAAYDEQRRAQRAAAERTA